SDCQGNPRVDQQYLPQATEVEIDEYEDEHQGRGDEDREAHTGGLEVFVLPAEFDGIVVGQMHPLPNTLLCFPHDSFHIAHVEVHHQCCAPPTVIPPDRLDRLQGLEFYQSSQGNETGLADAHRQLPHLLVIR